MATATFDSQPGGTQTLATFKGWAKGFHDALIAVGLVQTSDTGQVDLNAVAVLPTASTTVGYIIYRFNDTMQATAPLFLRIEYKVGASSRARIDFQVGTSTDGAGTLNGFAAVANLVLASNADSNPYSTFVAAGDGYLAASLFCWTATGPGTTMFILERSREIIAGTDTPTGAGVLIGALDSNIKTYSYTAKVALDHRGGNSVPTFGNTISAGLGLTPVRPALAFLSGGVPWQPVTFVGVLPTDAPTVPFDVILNGVTRTYLVPTVPAGIGFFISSSGTIYARSTAILYS